jgi:exonuclease III
VRDNNRVDDVQELQQGIDAIKIITWNCNRLSLSRLLLGDEIRDELGRADIICLQEAPRSLVSEWIFLFEKSFHIVQNKDRSGRAGHGLAILIRKSLQVRVVSSDVNTLWVQVTNPAIHTFIPFYLCNIYVPPYDHSLHPVQQLNALWNSLVDTATRLAHTTSVILAGDLNTGSSYNARKFHHFLSTSGFMSSSQIHVTYRNSRAQCATDDFILASNPIAQAMQFNETYQNYQFNPSDHIPVSASIIIPHTWNDIHPSPPFLI